MKLASLKDGRDGRLVVVDRNLQRAVEVPDIAKTMQQALDNWEAMRPALEQVAARIDGHPGAFDLDTAKLAAPLPRAYQWVDGSAYVNHVELVRKARGAEMPQNFWTDPLMYQGCSDGMLGCNDDVPIESEDWGIDFEAELAVITDDTPMGVSEQGAAAHIKLITLVNDVSLRMLIPGELGKGFGFLQSKPATSFAPVVCTLDELGDAWRDGRVHLPLCTDYNGERFGAPEAGPDMTFSFPRLVSHAAKSRHLCAGTIVGSGTVSNEDRSRGSSCLAERRMLEIIEHGAAKTPFMRFGDRVRIEMKDKDGVSIFGAIDQTIVRYEPQS
ncbi:MAG: fumarylacetoacetate hydrolase family protein [Myxococcales bacterium]|nr:fumarylacetoacetate hydrolase family protein [Myxococcales bacterium]